MKQRITQIVALSGVGHGKNLARRAFTIIELMVVVLIGLVILTIAVPAFQTMIYSSNQSLAANAILASSQMARDVALSTGQDGAVVFVYDPQVGKVQIIPAVKVGTLREKTTAGSGSGGSSILSDSPFFDRDVFVPAAVGETIELPRFWMVRGYAPPRSMIDRDSAGNAVSNWYTSEAYGGTDEGDDVKAKPHWVFPETGFFPSDVQFVGAGLDGDVSGSTNSNDPTARQSFMIRFSARTGVVSKDSNTVLFINPRNSQKRPFPDVTYRANVNDSFAQSQVSNRIDMAEDIEVWAARLIGASNLNGDNIVYGRDDEDLRTQLIGNASNDTILVKSVTRLALYDERKLALGVGARGLNQVTQTLYLPADQDEPQTDIEFDLSLFDGLDEEDILDRIDQWINGNTTFAFNDDLDFDSDDEPESRIYLIQPYTGQILEVLR